ncbi:Outer membrane protein [Pleurostoma richardsiae]|uniref:Outer membrane protein n=1 Tax=Pleurostoma richardsiae TaxID=41990 RepID=A0AA38VEY3_9PEZI|nr:Outer membrane protein [Pleurostoma richardsiae]
MALGEIPSTESEDPEESKVGQRAHWLIARLRCRDPGQDASLSHPLAGIKSSIDVLVDFEGPDDLYRPVNWPFRKKVMTTVVYGLITMGSAWASSAYSPAIPQVVHEFHVGEEAGTLGISLFLFGIGLGSLLWAPISEVYGRKIAVLTPYFLSAIFSFASAVAKDVQTVMITRIFSGFFGAAPITNVGGAMSDIWFAQQRGAAIVVYAVTLVAGTVLAPIVGGAAVDSYLGWRWTEYITGILMSLSLTLGLIFLDESYPPVLLVYKARRLRLESGNWALHARHEEWDVSLKDLSRKYLIRPFQLMATPICFFVALYASFVYGILYLSLASFPIEFQELRGWNAVIGALPFLALFVGILFGAAANLLNQRFYVKRFRANNNRPVPEARLPPMMAGSVFFAAGMFIQGWTSKKDVFWFGSICGAFSTGLGFFTIFQAALNYLIDTFQQYAASAVAVNTFLRSIFAGSFPLFTNAMFHNLGIPWASSLLGFISVALIPIPYVLYIFGPRIRARGKWSKASVAP